MEMTSQNISSEHKLINFNVPKYLIKNFDNLVRFKRVSRTSMLVHLMEHYIRSEKKRIEEDGDLNFLINDIEQRNRKSVKDEMVGLHKEIEEEFEPPLPPNVSPSSNWKLDEDKEVPNSDLNYTKDDWNDVSGIGRLWNLK